jgi:hypothetical protein
MTNERQIARHVTEDRKEETMLREAPSRNSAVDVSGQKGW